MGTVTIIGRMGVEPEDLAHVTAIASEMSELATGEPGTLTYDWHYSEPHRSLLAVQTYADSAAHFTHMQALGHDDLMSRLMARVTSMEFFVLGEPTAEHAEALEAIPGAQFYSAIAATG